MQEDFFNRNIIIYPLMAEDSADAICQIGHVMEQQGYIKSSYTTAVLEREKTFPTGLTLQDTSIAIPHATPDGNVLKNGIAVARLAKPVTFHSMEYSERTTQVELIFLLALEDSQQHLDVLKQLFTTFQQPAVLQALKDACTPDELLEIIQTNIKHVA